MLSMQSSRQLSLTIVDHNVLGEEWRPFAASLKCIVDHHEDQTRSSNVYSDEVLSSLQAEITVIGSTATLVAGTLCQADLA